MSVVERYKVTSNRGIEYFCWTINEAKDFVNDKKMYKSKWFDTEEELNEYNEWAKSLKIIRVKEFI